MIIKEEIWKDIPEYDNYLWKCVHKQKICKGLHFIII
jgi:hypothetical protein